MNKKMKNKLLSDVGKLVDDGFTEIKIQIIDEGYLLNPTRVKL